jgi:hypothetical protein
LVWGQTCRFTIFHLRTGETLLLDDEGTDHRDFEAAYLAAVSGARDLMATQVREEHLMLDESVEVHDTAGVHLATIRFADALRISFPPK